MSISYSVNKGNRDANSQQNTSHRNGPLQNSFLEVNNLTWFEPKILQFLHIYVSESLGASTICMCPESLKNLIRQTISATKGCNILFDARLKI